MTIIAESLAMAYAGADGQNTSVFDGVDIAIGTGEFVSIIGPSGCGKSTLLHCIGGLLGPTSGRVLINDDAFTHPDPSRAAFVFQDYSLLPWMTVAENVAIGLRFAGVPKRKRLADAARWLDLVGLADVADSYPKVLSGGMQQRVAVARALAMEPEIMLMDEPFGALDEQTRRSLGAEMSELLTKAGKTVVMVTHSLDEAIYWGDRVFVMSTRPAGITDELHVPAARPRSLSMIAEDSFAQARATLFEQLAGQEGASGDRGRLENSA